MSTRRASVSFARPRPAPPPSSMKAPLESLDENHTGTLMYPKNVLMNAFSRIRTN